METEKQPQALSYKERQKLAGDKYREGHRDLVNARARANWKRYCSDPVKGELVKQKNRDRAREWRKKNPEKLKAAIMAWKNTERGRELFNARCRRARKRNPMIAMKGRLRARIYDALKKSNAQKKNTTETLLGCSFSVFRDHIQSLFKEGMAWNNRHLWEIDHIIPCSKFDLLDPEEQKKCFNYKNLQPLWTLENRKKSDRVEEQLKCL